MQQIHIIGNLVSDARQVQGQNGAEPFLSLKVAVNDKKGEIEVKTFYEATYNKVGGVFPFLKKGKKVYISGTPSAKVFQTKEGENVAIISIRIHTLELL